jgi:signal peptidase I
MSAPLGQLAEPARRDKEFIMRFGFWKLFSGFALLLITLYLVNPLGVPSLDPRLRLLGIAPFTIPARSMAPTLEPGDMIIVSAWLYRSGEPKRGDLGVYLQPQRPDIKYVKRVIGLPDERVVLLKSKVFINGVELNQYGRTASTCRRVFYAWG